jgi:hypothetical protein
MSTHLSRYFERLRRSRNLKPGQLAQLAGCTNVPKAGHLLEAALLEASAGTARAEIVASELFLQHLVAVDDLCPLFDLRFGRVSSTALTHRLEKTTVHRNARVAWSTSSATIQ